MQEKKATLIVRRIGGLFRRSVQRSLKVVMDKQQIGVVGKEIQIDPGSRTFTVKTQGFTCKPLEVEIEPASLTILECRSSLLAYFPLPLGSFLFWVLSFPANLILGLCPELVDGDVLPPEIALIILMVFLYVWLWIAYIAPLRILSLFGIYSHRLTDPSDARKWGQAVNSE